MTKDTGIVNIHGKQYHTVAKRVQDFRAEHPNFGLLTEVAFREGSLVAVKASIVDEESRVIATGHAEEDRTKGQINKTSALENAETSAIGRALAAFGMAGTEFASANEVENAVHQQNEPTTFITEAQRTELQTLCETTGISVIDVCRGGNVQSLKDIPADQFDNVKKWINEQKRKAA